MDMVSHQAKSVNPVQEPLARFLENLVKAIPVLVVGKYILTCIAAKDNVVNCPRRMYAWFSRHG
jgi:hypothetical protein